MYHHLGQIVYINANYIAKLKITFVIITISIVYVFLSKLTLIKFTFKLDNWTVVRFV